MDTPAAKNPEVSADEEQKPVRRKRLPIIIIAAIAVLAIIGGGAYWFISHKHATPDDKEKVAVKESPPIYVPLETLTVNLQDEGKDQFLQTAMTLKVSGEPVAEKLKTYMPEVRSHLIFLLSSKRASELITTSGKEKLSRDILANINRLLEGGAAGNAAPEEPVPAAAPDAPAPTPAASNPPANSTTAAAQPAPAGTEAPAPAEAEAKPAAAAGDSPVTDVIFTSFLIQ